jgi:hypothetical protein
MSEKFNELLAELNQASDDQQVMAKSINADPAAAAAAAAAPGAAAAVVETPNPEDAADGGVLAKALDDAAAVLAAGGAPADAPIVIDGEEIFKSLEALGGRQSVTEETLTKGLTVALGMLKTQGALIKSLNDRVEVLGGTGAGRKTMIQVQERQPLGDLAKSEPAGMTAPEVLAKAGVAFDAKKITGLEFTALDVSLRNGQVPDAGVLNKILS